MIRESGLNRKVCGLIRLAVSVLKLRASDVKHPFGGT